MTTTSPEVVLAQVIERYKAWLRYFKRWKAIFWTCGIVATVASTLAATQNVWVVNSPNDAIGLGRAVLRRMLGMVAFGPCANFSYLAMPSDFVFGVPRYLHRRK